MLSRPQYDSDLAGEEDVRGNDKQAAHEKRTVVNKMTVKIFFTLFPFDSFYRHRRKIHETGHCPIISVCRKKSMG